MKILLIAFLLLPFSLLAQNTSIGLGYADTAHYIRITNTQAAFPTPQVGTLLHLISDAPNNGRVSFDTYNNTSFTGSNYQGRRARGTAASPTPPILDDVLVALGADGYGTSSFTGSSVGSMNIRAEGTFTNTSKPTNIQFTTTPSGSTTQVERFRIKSDGTLNVTSFSTAGILQTGATGDLSAITTYSAGQFLRRNAGNTAFEFATLAGGGDLLAANNLSDVASASTSRTNLGLGNVDNTSDVNKPVSTATQTALDLKANTTAMPTRVFLPSDVINNNITPNTIADVTALSFPVVANTTYKFRFWIIFSSAATTTGSRWSINGPATTFMNYYSNYTLTATSITNNQGLSSYNSPSGVSASSLTTNNVAIIEGVIRPSANGSVIARFSSEIASSAITAVASGRSYVEYQIIN